MIYMQLMDGHFSLFVCMYEGITLLCHGLYWGGFKRAVECNFGSGVE